MALAADKFIITDGGVVGNEQPMQSTDFGPADMWDTGNADYADTLTAVTPIAIPGTGAFVPMTNNGLGPSSVNSLPNGITDIWDTSTGVFSFVEFSNGDIVSLRIDLVVTTTSNNQEVLVDLELGQTGAPFTLPLIQQLVKTAGVYRALNSTWFDLRNDNTRLNPGQILVASDSPATVLVHGWNCLCTKKGRV